MKVVNKPWGREDWIELNERYCFKRIVLKPGMQTSLQYHNFKLETNLIASGVAAVHMYPHPDMSVSESGVEMRGTLVHAGKSVTVRPMWIHRVANPSHHEDLVMIEVSTPEVDDVVRVEDDFGRGDGRIESEHG